MKKLLSTLLALVLVTIASAIDVKTVRVAGPFRVQQPIVIDSLNASQQKINTSNYMTLLNNPVSLNLVKTGLIQHLKGNSAKSGAAPAPRMAMHNDSTAPRHINDSVMPRQRRGGMNMGMRPQMPQTSAKPIKEAQIQLMGFSFNVASPVKADIKVTGPKYYTVFINGRPAQGRMPMLTGRYDAVVKYVADTTDVAISINADKEEAISLVDYEDEASARRPFTMSDNLQMKHYSSISISPSGKYAIITTNQTENDGRAQYQRQLLEVATGKVIRDLYFNVSWMPHTDRYIFSRRTGGHTQLVSVDPLTLKEEILNSGMPSERFILSPTEDFVILIQDNPGPQKEKDVYQILTMSDRQQGWRNRSSLAKMDLKTGLVQPLTYGHHSISPCGISDNGVNLYFTMNEERLEKRPTTVESLFRLNLETMQLDTLLSREEFLGTTRLIPGTNKFAIVGSPEAFNGIGKNLPADMTPSIYDHQLFIFDADTKKVDAVTRDFNPSVNNLAMNGKDGFVYFTADVADSVSLFRLNLKNYAITRIPQPCEVLQAIGIASNTGTMLFCGSSACTPDQVYTLNTKTLKSTLLSDVNAERMKELQIGTCEGWKFKSERGYDITGHVYLPANYDASKKYPMIVHYYGGCSPTSRRFGNGASYPAHYWNAQGYVVLIVNPSGACGFGQEWAARHVNTAGEGPAQDIIEATKWYADNHPFIDAEKLGCVSASYGGFMTQYILTKTDMFACGISHAGISDHTSYWGEGYWGYNYSEVSMANSYPWTRKDLYVDRSPLFNADKIHKPLLFTHGTADTNVPIGESIQMYTALKLLGVPTAFIMVEGENHGISEFNKRQKWINSMTAWFDKYLKGDSTWWDMIYTPKEL